MQMDLQLAAMEAIMECMVFAIETSLSVLSHSWKGPVPAGLQILLSAKDPTHSGNAASSGHKQGDLKQLKNLPSAAAVQVSAIR